MRIDKVMLWTAAVVTTLASFTFLIWGLYNLLKGDTLLGVVAFLVGLLLGSFIKDYGRMIKEYR